MKKPQPWSPADATEAIRRLANDTRLTLSYSIHFKERLFERDLLISDVLYVLKNGFVFEPAVPSTQADLFKYKIETRTPNSNNRSIRVVIVPDTSQFWMKCVTVMWVDE
jgi:hypothetical protein